MHKIGETEEKSENEYNELSDEKKAKYTQVPKDALLEENVKTLVSTGLPNGGGVLIELRNTTVINGKIIWVLAKNLAKSISTTVLSQTQDSIYSVTTFSYEAYTYYNNWFMSNVGLIGNSIAFRYGPCGESIISYYTVSNYPGGNLTNYLNYLK